MFPTRTWSAALALSVLLPALLADPAHAAFRPSRTALARFQLSSTNFLSLDEARLKHFFELKTAKGESVFSRETPTEEHSDLWSQKTPTVGGDQGTATDDAYRLYKPAPGAPVIVAVIDSAIDIDHVDLKGKIWKNPREIPNNGIDDDHNGFIDDVNGWNFLGGMKDGKPVNVRSTTLELTREFHRMNLLAQTQTLSPSDEAYHRHLRDRFNSQLGEAVENRLLYEAAGDALQILVAAGLNDWQPVTAASVQAVASTEPAVAQAKVVLLRLLKIRSPINALQIRQAQDEILQKVTVSYDEKFQFSTIIGDHENELDPVCASKSIAPGTPCLKTSYGNNDVRALSGVERMTESHGTHVAGIIAAIRDNGEGVRGQAENVVIMPIRAVPDGDERDKDVANAIRYAADNGAAIINMSFGKPYSGQKKWVDDAVRYARSRGVLLIHAAGNDGANSEESNRDLATRKGHFPNARLTDESGAIVGQADNWIEVGASRRGTVNGKPALEYLVASFSNYGKTSVDVFAPGEGIDSTTPHDGYGIKGGTSMASPEVAGVAAYVWSVFRHSRFPDIRQALLSTVTRYPGLKVVSPAQFKTLKKLELVPFESLSATGGIVNAQEAVLFLDKRGIK